MMHPVEERCSRRAVQLAQETAGSDDCQMPSHIAFMVGGPKDGEHMLIHRFLDVIEVPAPPPSLIALDPVIVEMESQFPVKMAADGTYRVQGWAKATHALPWCDRDHYVIEYLWHE